MLNQLNTHEYNLVILFPVKLNAANFDNQLNAHDFIIFNWFLFKYNQKEQETGNQLNVHGSISLIWLSLKYK